MKIEPVGRERNLQIAELKGWKLQKYTDKLDRKWGLAWQYPIGKFICWEEHFDCTGMWSTDRNDAGELEKEFIEGGFIVDMTVWKNLSDKSYGVVYVVRGMLRVEIKTQSIMNSLNKAIANCISQAWIQWKKENEKDKQKI